MQVGEQYIDAAGRNLKYIGLNKSKQMYVFEWINLLGQKIRIQSPLRSQHHHYRLLNYRDPEYHDNTDDEFLSDIDGGKSRKARKSKKSRTSMKSRIHASII